MTELLMWMIGLLIVTTIVRYAPFVYKYIRSDYKNESGVGLIHYLRDLGSLGEAFTFFELEKLPGYSKILTNVYLPTEDGTTEVDLIYISESGFYVLESKNYSGWIYGNERSKQWTSVIYKNKYRFFNPIWQNRKHVKYLREALGDIYVDDIVVFSERCELKKINVGSNTVLKRNNLRKYISSKADTNVYTVEEIDSYYQKLKPFSLQSDAVKQQHIDAIKK